MTNWTGSNARICLACTLMCTAIAGHAGCDQPGAAASATGSPSASPLIVNDDAGREVSIARSPKRIACGTMFAVELLVNLGQPPVLRPELASDETFPPEVERIEELAIDHGVGPNMEQLVAARPDLVILHTRYAQFAANIEQATGVKVLVLQVSSFEDVLDKITLFGRIIGHPDRSESMIADLEAAKADIVRDLPAAEPRVLALFGTSEGFYAFLPSSCLGDMTSMLGGRLITSGWAAARGLRTLAPLDLEQAVEANPEVILVVRHGNPDERLGELGANPAWARISAVREGRVHALSQHRYLSNPGPRLVESMAELRELLYPTEALTRKGRD